MRQWNVDPRLMCRSHLLGEHLENHMFHNVIHAGGNVSGYMKNGILECKTLTYRHNQLVEEMENRGYHHQTPIDFDIPDLGGVIDISQSFTTLMDRCINCRKLLRAWSVFWFQWNYSIIHDIPSMTTDEFEMIHDDWVKKDLIQVVYEGVDISKWLK